MTSMRSRLTTLFFVILLAVWAGMAAYLFKETKSDTPLNDPIKLDILQKPFHEFWYGVYYKDKKVGVYQTIWQDLSKKDEELTGYSQEGFFELKSGPLIPGRPHAEGQSQEGAIKVRSMVIFQEDFTVNNFFVSIDWQAQQTTKITGVREDDIIKVTVTTGESEKQLEIPSSVWTSTLVPLGYIPFKEKKFTMKMFNPLTSLVDEVIVEDKGTQTLYQRGHRKLRLLSVTYESITSSVWLDEAGFLWKEESPLGVKIVRETEEEAHNFSRRISSYVPRLHRVPVSGICNFKSSTRIQYRLEGLDPAGFDLTNARQRVLETAGDSVTLEVKRGKGIEEGKGGQALSSDQLQPLIAPEVFIESDDEEIREKALQIAGGQEDTTQIILRVFDWVFENIQKEPLVTLPSAKNVLYLQKGDCNEHTNLFVALLRSLRIPARVVIGLFCREEGCYYHAWPEVYVGKWVEIDPTLGEFPVGPAHIRLLEGGLYKQVRIIKVLGKLKVQVDQCR